MSAIELVEAPDFVEPLEGWRAWRVVDARGAVALGSIVKSTTWPQGEPLRSECLKRRLLPRLRRQRHESPMPTCTCGIYATSLEVLEQYVSEAFRADAIATVVGRVALWGTVIMSERGLRASCAYPLELYVPADNVRHRTLDQHDVAERLAQYGVPVKLVDVPARDAPALLAHGRLSTVDV